MVQTWFANILTTFNWSVFQGEGQNGPTIMLKENMFFGWIKKCTEVEGKFAITPPVFPISLILVLMFFVSVFLGRASASENRFVIPYKDGEISVVGCSLFQDYNGKSVLLTSFPEPVEEMRELYKHRDIFTQGRYEYSCQVSTAIVQDNLIWLALDQGNMTGIGSFNFDTKETGVFHHPDLIDCRIYGLRITKKMLYVPTYWQGDIGWYACSGIVGINLASGKMISYARDSEPEAFPKILDDLSYSSISSVTVQNSKVFPLQETAELSSQGLQKYMMFSFEKENKVHESVMHNLRKIGENTCELLASGTTSCQMPLKLGNGNLSLFLIDGGIPGTNYVHGAFTDYESIEFYLYHAADERKIWPGLQKSYFLVVSAEGMKPKAGREDIKGHVKIKVEEFLFPTVETPEQRTGLITDRISVLEFAERVGYSSTIECLVYRDNFFSKHCINRLSQMEEPEKVKVGTALIWALKSDEPQARRNAAFALKELRSSPQVLSALKAALSDPSDLIKVGAAQVFLLMEAPYLNDAIPDLLKLLQHPKKEVSDTAYYALGKSPWLAYQPLIELFKETSDPELKAKILYLMAEIKYLGAVPFLLDIARTYENGKLKFAASKVLLYIYQDFPVTVENIPVAIAALKDHGIVPDREDGWLIKAGEIAVPALIEVLRGTDEYPKRTVIDILRQMGLKAKDAAPALKELADSPNNYIREGAQSALLAMNEKLAQKDAVTLSRDLHEGCDYGDPGCHNEALSLLGEMGPEAKIAVPALKGILYDYGHGKYAAAALAKIAPEQKDEYFEILVRALDDYTYSKDHDTGEYKWQSTGNSISYTPILEGLAALGPAAKEAVPHIEKFLKERAVDEWDKTAAQNALRKIDPDKYAAK